MYVPGVLMLPMFGVDALSMDGTRSVGGVADIDGVTGLYGMTLVLASSICTTYIFFKT
jgi:hypothetical protein